MWKGIATHLNNPHVGQWDSLIAPNTGSITAFSFFTLIANLIRPSRRGISSDCLIRPSHPVITSGHLIQPSHPVIPSGHLIRPSYPAILSSHLVRPSYPVVPLSHPIRPSLHLLHALVMRQISSSPSGRWVGWVGGGACNTGDGWLSNNNSNSVINSNIIWFTTWTDERWSVL